MTDLRAEKSSSVEINRADVISAGCGFALAAFDQLAEMDLGQEGSAQCYACLANFTRDPDGKIFFTGQCISTYQKQT